MLGIKLFLHNLREGMGLAFYLKPKEYDVKYKVKIENCSKVSESFNLVLPVPSDSSLQFLKSEVEFSVSPAEIKKDKKYDNKYAVWNLFLESGQFIEIEEKFKIYVQPQKSEIIKNKYYLQDYNKDDFFYQYVRENKYTKLNEGNFFKKIVGEEKDVFAIAKKVNQYVIDNLKYGQPILGLYPAEQAVQLKEVDCGGFSSLFVALMNFFGIPARIVSGFWAGYSDNAMHAWAEFMLPDGKWIPVDPATEQLRQKKRTKKFGFFGKIGSDRIVFSLGCDVPICISEQEHFVDILQNPNIFSKQKLIVENKITTKCAE